MSQELIVIEDLNPATLFAGEGLNELLDMVSAEVKKVVLVIDTATERKEFGKFCRKIITSENKLDTLGKDHVAAKKNELKVFDLHRKKAREFLRALHDETRKPLTDWEEAEEKRVQDIADRIEAIKLMAPTEVSEVAALGLKELQCRMRTLKEIRIDEDFEEMAPIAEATRDDAIQALAITIGNLIVQAKEKSELERLRTLEAEQKQKDREEQIRKDAAAEAKVESERKERKAIEAQESAEQRTRDAEQAAQREKEAAEQRAKEARLAATRQAEQAAQAERDRFAATKTAEANALAKRAANTRHKGKINSAAVEGLMKLSFTQEKARKIVTAIAKGDIPFVQIHY